MNDQSDAEVKYPVARALASIWWVVLLRGLLLIGLGLYALLMPELTLVTYCVVLAVFLAADGVLAIIAGIAGWVQSRLWVIVRGVLALVVAGLVFAQPVLFATLAGSVLIYFIAFGLIFGGVLEIVAAIQHRKAIEGEWWLVLEGVLSILFGGVLAIMPLVALQALIMVSGIFAIVFGVGAIVVAFQMRNLESKVEQAVSRASQS